jgi:hypothetical protein
MFPLSGKKFPTSSEELDEAITAALTDVFTVDGDEADVVIIEGGGKFPALKTVTIDLDGASVTARKPPPKPIGTGKRQPGPKVDKLQLSAAPIRYEQAKLNLKLTASGLQFEFDRDKKGNPLLVLTDAKSGKVDARIGKDDIESLLTEAAGIAAKQQGIKIQDLELDLKKAGPLAVAADVRVTAKKLMMTGTIHITGRLDIDDELNATVSDLDCNGEGMIGTAAAGIVKKKLAPYDGTTVPLMAFSLGDVALRDLKIDLKKDLHVTAAFGS